MPPTPGKSNPPGATVWAVIRDVGGVPIVVAVVIFAARLDANVSKFAASTRELAGVVKDATAELRQWQLQRVRDSIVVVDAVRRLEKLEQFEEARRGRR